MTPYYDDGNGITIYHGDCREILPTLGRFDLLLTDPPYGINLSDNSQGGRYGRSRPAFENHIAGDESQDLGLAVLEWAKTEDLATVAFASPRMPWPGDWSSVLVWDKGPAVGGGGDTARCWKQSWELIQVARNSPLRRGRDASVLKFWATPALSKIHPAAKPVGLLKYLIGQLCGGGDVVLDPFMGSGSTLVAAKEMGLQAVGIELEERYCEIASKRLAQGVLKFA